MQGAGDGDATATGTALCYLSAGLAEANMVCIVSFTPVGAARLQVGSPGIGSEYGCLSFVFRLGAGFFLRGSLCRDGRRDDSH